ncbi:hypothetical protein C3L33_09105, partial [Rhododendron williamsianum]
MYAGTGLAGMRQKDLIEWYVSQLKEKNNNTSTEEAATEVSKVRGVIECLVMEGHLIVVDDGMQAASEADGDNNVRQSTSSRNDRILAVAPNKQGKTLVHKYPTSDPAESGAEPPSDNAECRAEPANRQGKKLGINDEYLQRVTKALFMRLREGKPPESLDWLAGIRERDLIEWYVIEHNKKIENPSIVEASAEASKVISIKESLVRGGLLIVVDDGTQVAAEEDGDNNARQDRILALKPNLQGNPCVLSAEYFESVGAALVMRLRQHEETVSRDGNFIAVWVLQKERKSEIWLLQEWRLEIPEATALVKDRPVEAHP